MVILFHRHGSVQRWRVFFSLLAGLCLAMETHADWEWSPTVTNLSVRGQDALIPQVASNNNGNAVAVWSLYDGVNALIQAAQFKNKEWGTAVAISASGGNASTPRVAVNGSGNARAIWISNNTGNQVVEMAGYNDKTALWSEISQVSAPGQDANTPRIAMNEAGATAIVWTLFNGSNWVVQAKLYVAGAWMDTITLSTPLRNAFTPEVVVSSSGAVIVVWSRLDFDNNTHVIESIRFQNGRWGEVNTISNPGLDTKLPQLAVDQAGNVTVVWMQANGELYNIQSRRWSGATGWDNNVALSPVGENADSPGVAADGSATAIAIWTQQLTDGVWTLRSKRFSAGRWGDLKAFASGGQSASSPHIAADNGGSATAVWVRSDGTHTLILGSHFMNGAWTPATALSAGGQNADLPQVTMLGKDQAALVWLRSNGSNRVVQARRGTYVNLRYSVTLSKSGSGTVISDPAGIDCGKTCTAQYDQDARVTLTATPAEGSNFIGWSGACEGTAPCIIKMTANKSVAAKFFAPAAYALQVTSPKRDYYWLYPPKALAGTVTSVPEGINCGVNNKACKYAFGKDAVVTLTATPQPGYYLKRWDGCATPNGLTCTVTVTKPTTTITPRFAALPKYALRVSKTKYGSITSAPAGLKCKAGAKSCSAKFVTGTEVVLTAWPATDRRFVLWGGVCSGTAPTCAIRMDAKKKVSAAFQ